MFINTLINMKSFLQALFLFLFMLNANTFNLCLAAENKAYVVQINLLDEISTGSWRSFNKAFNYAVAKKADAIVLHLNTYGGMLDAADSIRSKILSSKIPVYAFIDNNAASAGALISIACNKIFMVNGSSIGAATVVNASGEPLPDKYQSYMRSMMRATAEARQRNPSIAEAMVDPRTFIAGVNDSGKVLTFTVAEALKNNYCDAQVSNLGQLLHAVGIDAYTLDIYHHDWVDKAIAFLLNPAVSGVLILTMLGGLYFELQHPGVGLPLFLAIGAALLYFAPHYLEGLAQNWELLLFIAGLALLALEIFVLPGFGIAGIAAIVCIVLGLALTLVHNDGFDFSVSGTAAIMQALATVVLAKVLVLVLFIFTGERFILSPLFNKLVLTDALESATGYVTSKPVELIGKQGIAFTDLRPAGKIKINEAIHEASAESNYIPQGTSIEVISHNGVTIIVRALQA